jgi:hypothetical protein
MYYDDSDDSDDSDDFDDFDDFDDSNEFWYGNLNFFRKQLRISGSWPLDDAVKCMFGQSWTAVIGKGDDTIDTEISSRFRSLKDMLYPGDGNTGLYGMYDLSLETNAATKIQAAYRGWKARMRYRFNPHTTLGAYYVIHMFEDIMGIKI